ncbi:PREDICTED: nudix hydrolase 23, chloroplastic [Nelumbo nucifera]|uniref:Nudix hydrolase 23, chloroplastic n=2 Tax=Nelumbo nucifera TaxID=4432 RepID=A0A1U8AJ45_NELNU|nr:PREDICTED: nudix hydrolase 23, chloroplastic [Nelumbo nucifera]XP_010265932.1 PREDICTED: nudix hydrolase 23, chloroplastic [Nelumbo nucifera]XP_010265933.1 PREDICTED: nudix hydrolase 23, chloroplastic [Nelumbo nucifera]DAD30026.1 TPA_asm: hypothetical protein HUJ06_031494 [Nelumbo nucifera]
MLRAIQFLGYSSGVVSSTLHRWKPHGRGGKLSLMSISTKSASTLTSGRVAVSLLLSDGSTVRGGCFGAFRTSATRSESNSDCSSSPSPATAFQSLAHINFCQWCGGPTKQAIPDGDERMRDVCQLCGKVAYQNPKMIVGCLVEHDGKVLLCKRNIPPSYGLWTLPAGYMEIGESAAEGAIRETSEETGADVELVSPFAQLDIPLIGQSYIIFRARMKKVHFSPGPESLDCQLFALDDIPFDSLAFSSMLVTLNMYIEDIKTGKPKFHYGIINKRPGTRPDDIHAYTLDHHMQS